MQEAIQCDVVGVGGKVVELVRNPVPEVGQHRPGPLHQHRRPRHSERVPLQLKHNTHIIQQQIF